MESKQTFNIMALNHVFFNYSNSFVVNFPLLYIRKREIVRLHWPLMQTGCMPDQEPLVWHVLRWLPLRAYDWLQKNSTVSGVRPGTDS